MKNKPISLRLVFEDTISLFKKHFLFLFIIFSLNELINIPSYSPQLENFFVQYSVLSMLIFTFTYAVATLYISRKNKNASLQEDILQASRRLIPLLIFTIVFLLLFLFGLLAFLIPGILVSLVFSQAYYFILLENKGVLESFGLSRALTKGNRMKILPIVFLVFLPVAVMIAVSNYYNVSINYYNLWLGIFSVVSGSFTTILSYSLWKNLRAASSMK